MGKTDKYTTINLDNIVSIQIFTIPGKCNIVFADVKGGYYSSQHMSKEECRKVYDLVISKLFTNELIDINKLI